MVNVLTHWDHFTADVRMAIQSNREKVHRVQMMTNVTWEHTAAMSMQIVLTTLYETQNTTTFRNTNS